MENKKYDLPNSLKLDENHRNQSNILKSNCFISKGTKIIILNGVFVDKYQSDNCLQVKINSNFIIFTKILMFYSFKIIDSQKTVIGWLEINELPEWMNYFKINQDNDDILFNISAVYSDNKISCIANNDIEPETELFFNYKAVIDENNDNNNTDNNNQEESDNYEMNEETEFYSNKTHESSIKNK